jgi:hypothetical protein
MLGHTDSRDVPGAKVGGAAATIASSTYNARAVICRVKVCAGDDRGEVKLLPPIPTQANAAAGKGSLRVQFSCHRQKAFEESVPLLSIEVIKEVFATIISRKTSRSMRAASSGRRLLDARVMAERSPPMFWSVWYHFGRRAAAGEDSEGQQRLEGLDFAESAQTALDRMDDGVDALVEEVETALAAAPPLDERP